MRLIKTLALTGLAVAAQSGCTDLKKDCAGKVERGHIFMLPGVESSSWQFGGVIRGLREAGVESEVEIIEWGDRPLASMQNLMNIEKNLERAKNIARRIADFSAAHPDSPVTLVGYSGGGGMAVLIAEALPDGVKLKRVVLISAAIDPKRDLTRMQSHSRDGVTNFYSKVDCVMLGLGTSVFGTIDRVNTWSAGSVGFQDAQGKLKCMDGLTQIAWRTDWIRLGHYGGHIGWLSQAWSREQLAPVVEERLAAAPSAKEGGKEH